MCTAKRVLAQVILSFYGIIRRSYLRIHIISSLLVNGNLLPDLVHALNVYVGQTETGDFRRNIAALCKHSPPRIDNLSMHITSDSANS